MELATLVYWIGVLNPLAHFLIFIFVTSVFTAFILIMYRVIGLHVECWDSQIVEDRKRAAVPTVMKYFYACIAALLVSGLANVFLPSERTAYMMLGAYAAQKVAQDDRTQEIAGKIMKIANAKLDQYVEEAVSTEVKKGK